MTTTTPTQAQLVTALRDLATAAAAVNELWDDTLPRYSSARAADGSFLPPTGDPELAALLDATYPRQALARCFEEVVAELHQWADAVNYDPDPNTEGTNP